jgi:hypothetical protein
MAQTEAQLHFKRGPSTVIQGKRLEIAAQLDQLDDEEEMTLIVPGKPVEAGSLGNRTSFDAVFGPLQKGFEESGMTEEEMGAFVDEEVREARAARRAQEQPFLLVL